MSNPIDSVIDAIRKGGLESLIAAGDEDLVLCYEAISVSLHPFSVSSQVIGLALIFGTLCAIMEGEPCDSEKEGHLMTYEDRLRLFVAQAQASYDASMKAREHPDYPKHEGARQH